MKKPFKLIQVFDDPAAGYRGNISAVILLDKLPPADILQRIASDFAQPATTFLAPAGQQNHFLVRWFAPDGEIDLCGHGSSAAMAFLNQEWPDEEYTLRYTGGELTGKIENGDISLISLAEIPVLKELPVDQALKEGLGVPIIGYWHTKNKDIVLVNSEIDLANMKPDFNRLRDRKTFGYAVTAKAENVDFASRTLVPHVSQLEDQATGSSHAILAPFWAKRMGKNQLTAVQLSPRKGRFSCIYKPVEGQVQLKGHFSIIASGQLNLESGNY